MTVERAVRAMAGTIILISLFLAWRFTYKWLLVTGFVGLNLLQSAFTGWCPAISIFKKIGLKEKE